MQYYTNANILYYTNAGPCGHNANGVVVVPGSGGGGGGGSVPTDNIVPDVGCDCSSGGQLIQNDTNGMGNVPAITGAPNVRYADGVVAVTDTQLTSSGFGMPWGQTLSWSNGTGYATDASNGSGWVSSQLPYLMEASGTNSLVAITNSTTARYFDLVSGSYQPRYYDQSQLAYNSSTDEYTLTDTSGDVLTFCGFGSTWPTAQQGQLASFTDPAGNVTSVTSHNTAGQTTEVQRSTTSGANTITESYLYSYISSGVNAGLMDSVTLRRQINGGSWTTVQKVEYVYYDGTQSYGNAGDLMTATTLDGSDNVLDTSYYRYYTPDDAGSIGYVHGLKYAFSTGSYERLVAAVGDPQTATDSDVAPYADNYFQYDSQQRVTEDVVQGEGCSACSGGLGTYTYSYTTSSNPMAMNSWAVKTVETLPDGNTNTVYTNYAGEVMLTVYTDTTSDLSWETFDKYNAQGQLIVQAQPSAVTGYDDSYADLLDYSSGSYAYLSDTSGLINLTDYYTTTTATSSTAGGVAGYHEDTMIEQGQTGTPISQSSTQYFVQTAGSVSVAPVATQTGYRNTDGTGAETTSYSYTWFSGTVQMQSEAVSKPVISSAENGPASADVTTSYFDTNNNTIWVKDPDAYLTYYAYDPSTGAQVTQIVDVNTADTSEFSNLPSGWSTPTGGGLNLITTDVVDPLGRPTEETSPAGDITYIVYNDPNHEIRVYPGWNSSTGMPTGPTEVTRDDLSGAYTESYTMSAAPHLTGGVPDGTETPANLQTLSRIYLNDAGQQIETDDYFNLAGVTYSTAEYIGTAGTNYFVTLQGYDDRGRPNRSVSADGTITRDVYDGLGHVVSVWVGTDDTPGSGYWSPTNNSSPSNMVEVTANQYDNGGVGDGNLTQETDYPGGSATARVTDMCYDWRDELVATKSGVESSESDGVNRIIVYNNFDNLGEVIETRQYAADGVTLTYSGGVPQPPSSSLPRAEEIDNYDDQGRVFQTEVFDVNPTSGAVSSSGLTTNYYFDHRGDLIAESDPGGMWSKHQYDGAGREVMDFTTDGGSGTTWAAAGYETEDTVLEQVQTVFNNDGNSIETIDRQRFHNATGTGALGDPTSGVGARVYYAASYYDSADRDVADVNVGTNGGDEWTRPGTVPTGSSTVLVTQYQYNVAGWLQDTIDPLGIDTRQLYDNLGRTIEIIQNYTGGTPGNTNDVATEYGYDGDGNQIYVRADEPGGGYKQTDYVYGVTTVGGSAINSNDILAALEYPDPTTGEPSTSQEETYQVNALGQVIQATDRNGNVHQYSYDVLGRLTVDAVTTLGAGVDGSVRRIEYAHDSQGNQYLITSYNAATAGSIVNQVQQVYNGLGQMIGEYQSHSGAVETSTTPEVQYAYNELSGGANNSRLTSITYSSGYVVDYNYGTSGSLDDTISRLSSLSDSTGTLESYQYLGADTVVERDHPQSGVNLTYVEQSGDSYAITDGGDQYAGLDRFGRVIDQNWVNASTGASVYRVQYGHDAGGNVLYQQNLVDAVFSELYSYDSLNQRNRFSKVCNPSGRYGDETLCRTRSQAGGPGP